MTSPYYITEHLQSTGEGVDTHQPTPVISGDDRLLRVPAFEEEVVVRKRPVQIGTAHISKRVHDNKTQRSVPVFSERMVVEHIPPDEYDEQAPSNPNEIILPPHSARTLADFWNLSQHRSPGAQSNGGREQQSPDLPPTKRCCSARRAQIAARLIRRRHGAR
jgi:hypothetical protein